MIVRTADGLPRDTRNASRLSYWLNYMLNYLAQLHAQLPDSTPEQEHRAARGKERDPGGGGKHSVCVCVCVWYVSDLTHNGPDPRSSQIAIMSSQMQLAR